MEEVSPQLYHPPCLSRQSWETSCLRRRWIGRLSLFFPPDLSEGKAINRIDRSSFFRYNQNVSPVFLGFKAPFFPAGARSGSGPRRRHHVWPKLRSRDLKAILARSAKERCNSNFCPVSIHFSDFEFLTPIGRPDVALGACLIIAPPSRFRGCWGLYFKWFSWLERLAVVSHHSGVLGVV